MQSIIQPLNAKVQTLTTSVQQVIRGLSRGDPAAKKQVEDLCTAVSHIKADFKSTVNSMYASYDHSTRGITAAYNPTPLVSVATFYFKEAIA